jgi:galactonate dehydratase
VRRGHPATRARPGRRDLGDTKIAAIAEGFGAQIAPHLYAGPVEWAANIQLAATIPNLLMIECIGTGGAFHLPLIGGSLQVEDGFVVPPDTPGLGISFDEALALEHVYSGSALHLEMQETPCDYALGNSFEGGAPRD